MCLLPLTLLALTAAARAAVPVDVSGIYDCTGQDAHEGPYQATVTLTRNAAQSTGGFTAYDLKMEVPDYGLYLGTVTGKGKTLAVTFAHTDPKTQDYGTGLATVRRDKDGRLRFRKHYYEPAFKGGNTGDEDCVRRTGP